MIVALNGFLMTSTICFPRPVMSAQITSACTRTTNAIPIRCRVGSLCCLAKSILLSTPVPDAASLTALLDELLAADDPNLRKPEPLRRGHDAGDNVVLGELVRTKMNLGLDALRRGTLDFLLERGPLGDPFAVPVNPARFVDIDLHDFRKHERRRR